MKKTMAGSVAACALCPLAAIAFSPPDLTAEALDVAGLTFESGGDAVWFSQTSVSHDGMDAMQSGAIGDGKKTWLRTSVEGGGVLSFWWKCDTGDSLFGSDDAIFKVDGAAKKTIHGAVGWTQTSVRIRGAGTHTLEWLYAKDNMEVWSPKSEVLSSAPRWSARMANWRSRTW